MTKLAAMVALTAAMATFSASAQGAGRDSSSEKPPAAYQKVADCRAIADPAQRLSCYDQAVAALDQALQTHDVVMADRADVQKAKRGLFGFAAPIGHLLGLGGDDETDQVKQIDTTVTAVRHNRDGWLLTFAEGGTWQQIDMRDFVLAPKPGQKARITSGALGSYFVSVDGQTGRKFRRVE